METKMSASIPSDVEMPCKENKQIDWNSLILWPTVNDSIPCELSILLVTILWLWHGETFELNINGLREYYIPRHEDELKYSYFEVGLYRLFALIYLINELSNIWIIGMGRDLILLSICAVKEDRPHSEAQLWEMETWDHKRTVPQNYREWKCQKQSKGWFLKMQHMNS